MSTLPTKINIAAQYSPPVFDQLDLNSCVANAVCQAIAIQANEAGRSIGPLARLDLYYHTRALESVLESNPSLLTTDSGALVKDALTIAMTKGVISEALASNFGEGYANASSGNWLKKPTDTMDYYASSHKVTTAQALKYDTASDAQLHTLIGQQLLQGKSVIVSSKIPMWFQSVQYDEGGVHHVTPYAADSMEALAALQEKSQTGAYKAANNTYAPQGHAFLIVGMDDTLNGGKGGYIVENSGGTGIGVQGYDYLPYNFRSEGFLVTDMETIGGFYGADQTWTPERDQIAMMYASALNRAGENAGIDMWAAKLKAGTTLNKIAEAMVDSAEGKALYSINGVAMNNDQFIQKTYLDVRGRPATASELTSGNAMMNNGESHGQFLYNIMLDTQNSMGLTTAAEHDFLINRTTVSELYGITYHADGNHLGVAQTVLTGVTSDPNTVEAAVIGIHSQLGYV